MVSNLPKTHQWIPVSLRRMSLWGFALLYLCLIIVIGALYQVSQRHAGLATPNTRLHYLWTYIPSTIFIVISGVWILVELNAKLLSPWRHMAGKPSSAKKSLLLDYVSLSRFVALFRSFKHADWDVLLALAGTVCLNLLIIFSTGLFTSQQRTFSRSDYSFSTLQDLNTSRPIQTFGGSALLTAVAIGRYNLDYPVGTTKTFAYQPIDLTAFPAGSSGDLTVDAIYPEVVCETVPVNITFGIYYSGPAAIGDAGYAAVASNKNCQITWGAVLSQPAALNTYTMEVGRASCLNGTSALNTTIAVLAGNINITDYNMTEARRQNATRQYLWGSSGRGFVPLPRKQISAKATCAFCAINPTLKHAALKIRDNRVKATLIPEPGPSRILDRTVEAAIQLAIFGSQTLSQIYLTGVNDNSTITSNERLERYSRASGPFFQLVNGTNPLKSPAEAVSSEYVVKASTDVIGLIASQISSLFLFQDSVRAKPGQLTITRTRLVMPALALGLVLTLLIGMVLISLALSAKEKGAVPKRPASIADVATILARSAHTVALLESASHSRAAVESRARQTDHFQTSVTSVDGTPEFSIKTDLQASEDQPPKCESTNSLTIDWWHPWPSTLVWKAITLFFSAVGIVILEVLYRYSQRHQGIVDAPTGVYSQYAWIYLPVLVLFGLNSLFEATSSINRIIQPYVTMSNEPSPAARSISLDLVYQTTIAALFKSAKFRLFGTAAAILATLLGSTLPIVVSGLFTRRYHEVSQTIALSQVNGFNPSASIALFNSTTDFTPYPAFLLYSNISYPSWTYGKYAVPEVKFVDDQVLKNPSISNSTLRVDLPGVYGVLNCSRVPSSDLKYSTRPFVNSPTAVTKFSFSLIVSYPVPSDCPTSSSSIAVSATNFYIAKLMPLAGRRLANDTSVPVTPGTFTDKNSALYHGGYDIPAHCPLAGVFVAKGRWTNSTNTNTSLNLENSQVLLCRPHVKQETLDIHFKLPTFEIDAIQPPQPRLGTSRFFSDAELINTGSFLYYLPDVSLGSPTYPRLDPDYFFQAVMNGSQGISLEDTLSNSTNSTNILMNRMEQVYSTVVAQIYGARRRIPTAQLPSTVVGNGTLLTTGASRVQQDRTATRLIEGILAAMVICASFSLFFVNGHKVLPQNPCSIGAVAALLANSSILNDEVIPPGSEFMSAEELQQRGVFQDGLFSFGWWIGKRGRWYGIDMGKAEKAD